MKKKHETSTWRGLRATATELGMSRTALLHRLNNPRTWPMFAADGVFVTDSGEAWNLWSEDRIGEIQLALENSEE